MTFVDCLRAWHDFFLLAGGGAATLTVVASGLLSWRTSHVAILGVAVATLLLDLMGVRNTWQLVLWIIGARMHDAPKPP